MQRSRLKPDTLVSMLVFPTRPAGPGFAGMNSDSTLVPLKGPITARGKGRSDHGRKQTSPARSRLLPARRQGGQKAVAMPLMQTQPLTNRIDDHRPKRYGH
jgi:hypothetical protein